MLGDFDNIVTVLPGIVHTPVTDVAVASATFSNIASTPTTDIAVSWTSLVAYYKLPWNDPSVRVLCVGEDIIEFFFKRG